MQIIFDTKRDGHADAVQLQAMLAAFLAYAPPRVETEGVPHEGHEAPAVESPVSFTPGDLGAPSPADAAPSPIAPEVPQDGVPMPPSAASVPAPPSTVPEVPAVPTTSALTVDVHGLPWDERIHAGTKAKNADGSWRQRRGLNDPALVARVEAELRAGGPTLIPPAVPGDPYLDGVTARNVPPPPVVTAPPAPAAPDALTYDGFLAWVTPKMMDGSTPFDKVAAALSASSVSSLQELRDNPAAIPAVYAALGGV